MKRRFLFFLLAFLPLLAGCGRQSTETGAMVQTLLWIDLDAKTLTMYENGEPLRQYPIAAGASSTPSPIGVFRVNSRFMPDMEESVRQAKIAGWLEAVRRVRTN